jgi:tetratricopeptide (TPR) repeat protein
VRFAFFLVAVLPLAAQVPTKKQASPAPQLSLDPAQCAAFRHHGDPDAGSCYKKLTLSSDPGVRAEGYWGVRDYQSANDAFRAAIKLHPKDPNLRVRWGRMYLEHWQPSDASDLFNEALEIDKEYAPALMGLAIVAADGFEGKAVEMAQHALHSNPKLVEAQELIARIALEDSNSEKAAAEARKALDISPDALDAMAILATIDFLNDQKTSPWIDKILNINPMYGEAYETAAHFFVINRRYDEGILAYRKAIQLKPDLWSARSELGVNLMRLGKDGEARQQLEECWTNGYQSNSTKNSLTLLDSYKNFQTFETPTTILRLHKKEAALLRPYFQSELDRALATYEKKYHYKLKGPVQVEVYPDHEDFAVRTMGMPGLGALGVTFNQYVAMDSPSARKPGQFHWDSTMWHELSHVYVLAMTGSRVPRWFTEGLAVFEETGNGHPDWGDRLDPEAINAIKTKKLLPIAELDRGFIHPSYPSQVVVSYFQAGKICNFIDEKWGYDKLLSMIHDFAELTPTTQVIEKELKLKPEEFDRQFFAWLDAQTKATIDGFDEWKKQLRDISNKAKAKNWDDVIKEGTAIRDLYADYVEAGSVYEFLSDAYLAKGDKLKAIAELEHYSRIGGREPSVLKQLATLESEQGHKKEAVDALERLNFIYLKDEEAHKKLGELYMDLGNAKGAAREFQAVLTGPPIDLAGAHYELARAYQANHQMDQARDEVVSALEAAPGFKPAQKLLLELNVKE